MASSPQPPPIPTAAPVTDQLTLLAELRVLRLLVGISLLYWRHLISARLAVFRRKPAAATPASPRQATPGKSSSGTWLTVFLALSIVWLGFLQGSIYLSRMAERLIPAPPLQASAEAARPIAGAEPDTPPPKADHRLDRIFDGTLWSGGPADQLLILALGIYLLLLSLAQLAFLVGSGQQDLGKVDWDLEWLFTFPVPARTLFLARLLQNATAGQVSLWALMLPCLIIAYGTAGYGWGTLPLALLGTGSVALCNAALALLLETWVQKQLSPSRRKNLQAVIAMTATVLSLLTMVIGLSETLDGVIADAVRVLPLGLACTPFTLPALACAGAGEASAAIAGLALLGCFLPLGAVLLAQRMVRDGLISSPGAYQGERGQRRAIPATRVPWLDGIIGKDLRLLSRDRAFLAQTLLAPVIILAFTMLMYWHAGTGLLQSAPQAATLAFGVGAYVLAFSAFQAFKAEGNALWLLYTVPVDLQTILVRKTCLWCACAVGYVIVVLSVAVLAGMPLDGEAMWAGGLAVVGVVIYAFIAAALGTMAFNPLAAEVQRRMRVDLVYAYLILAGSYASALQAPSLWAQLVQVILSALVAIALWQKAQDRLLYLLEPVDVARPRVAVADGLIAALAFLTLQSFVIGLLSGLQSLSLGLQLLFATAVAGVVVTLTALVLLRRVPGLLVVTGLAGDPLQGRPGLLRTLLPGMLAGLLAGLCGVAYLTALYQVDALRAWKESWTVLTPLDDYGLLAWVVLAAPLFEEFIFRGLLYQGLCRSVPPGVAVVASAAIFAAVHPAISAIPVFVLGLATALAFRGSGRLVTPIVTHMLYNAMVVTAEGLMRTGPP